MEAFDGLLGLVVGLLSGASWMRWRMKQPRRVVAEDRKAGLARYQEFKAGR